MAIEAPKTDSGTITQDSDTVKAIFTNSSHREKIHMITEDSNYKTPEPER